jgi:hypothetical protein
MLTTKPQILSRAIQAANESLQGICHSERSEESLIIFDRASKEVKRDVSLCSA